MKTQTMVGPLVLAVLLAGTGLDATGAVVRSDEIVGITETTEPMIGGFAYTDVDKLNLETLTNYYDDLNNNDSHDPGEPFAATSQPGWGNPKSAADNSCWLASGCNMLEQLGKISDAEALYMDYALNGCGGLTWDDGGRQDWVIECWKIENPGLAADMEMHIHWYDGIFTGYGGYAWEDWDPCAGTQSYLNDGWEVAIGMTLLYAGEHHGGHALTMQSVDCDAETFQCTDSDRDDAGQDVNTYNYMTLVLESSGHTYYGWINDFYSRDLSILYDGDVAYVCAVIPEPTMLSLLVAGALMLVRRRRK